jgi:hypothetical protein
MYQRGDICLLSPLTFAGSTVFEPKTTVFIQHELHAGHVGEREPKVTLQLQGFVRFTPGFAE